MNDLHAAIMNLPCKPYDGTDAYTHYCRGHRDARHAAAELVAAAASGVTHARAAYLVAHPLELQAFVIAAEKNADDWIALNREVSELRAAAGVTPSDEAEFCIEDAGGMFLASSQGQRAEAWREIQHYAAQYAEEGPLTIYEITRKPVSTQSTT